MFNKNISTIVGIVVIVVLAVFVTGILAWQEGWMTKSFSQDIAAPILRATKPDKTAGWKTYRNELNGYEFKYPKDWKIYPGVNQNVFINLPGEEMAIPRDNGEKILEIIVPSVQIALYPANKETFKYLLGYKNNPNKNNVNYNYGPGGIKNINGIDFYNYSFISGAGGQQIIYIAFKDDLELHINLEVNDPYLELNTDSNYEFYSDFEKMLSTFKFLK